MRTRYSALFITHTINAKRICVQKMSSYVPSEDEKEKFMSRAIEFSKEGASKGHGGPFGAVVVKEGRIVG